MKLSSKIFLCIGGGMIVSAISKKNTIDKLKWFTPSEFGKSLPFLNNNLLLNLDKFRTLTNSPIYISPAEGSLFRFGNVDSSQHCVGNAADIFIDTILSFPELKNLAQQAGFSGIGIYPHWKWAKYPMAKGMHVDVRPLRTPINPALWAGIRDISGKQILISYYEGLKYA